MNSKTTKTINNITKTVLVSRINLNNKKLLSWTLKWTQKFSEVKIAGTFFQLSYINFLFDNVTL